jgi:hypothetical protein
MRKDLAILPNREELIVFTASLISMSISGAPSPSGRGRAHARRPPTPPDVRFRIRRFNLSSGVADGRHQREQPLGREVLGRQHHVHMGRSCVPPRTMTIAAAEARTLGAQAQRP